MVDSACLVHPFTTQENPRHALGDSISFGRFVSEPLSWEKWSTFSNKSYVEEAERYAQPGSVAQKKAFFEAHYKSNAAKKAAAVLEQANAANNNPKPETGHRSSDDTAINHSQVPGNEQHGFVVNGNGDNYSNAEPEKMENGKVEVIKPEVLVEYPVKEESPIWIGSPQLVKPALEGFKSIQEAPSLISNKQEYLSNSAIHQTVPEVPASPAEPADSTQSRRENNITPVTTNSTIGSMDEKKLTPKSQHHLFYSTPPREQDKSTTPAARWIDSSRVAPSPDKASKDCKTPLITPTKASTNEVLKNLSASPSSEIKRSRTPLDISTPRSKVTGPKWHIPYAM